MPDPHDVLGLQSGATRAEVRAAYLRLAKKHHPDKNPGDKASEWIFKEIKQAYEALERQEERLIPPRDPRRRTEARDPVEGERAEYARANEQADEPSNGSRTRHRNGRPDMMGTSFVVISVLFLLAFAVVSLQEQRDRLEPSPDVARPSPPTRNRPMTTEELAAREATVAAERERRAEQRRQREAAVAAERERRAEQRRQRRAEPYPYPLVTAAKYRELELGMSYRRVVEIIGFAGVELNRDEIDGTTRVRYEWFNPGSAEIIYALFRDDRMVQKTQAGLP